MNVPETYYMRERNMAQKYPVAAFLFISAGRDSTIVLVVRPPEPGE